MKRSQKKIPNYLMFAQALVDMYQAALAWYETVVEILLRSNVAVPMYIMDTIYGGKISAKMENATDYDDYKDIIQRVFIRITTICAEE